MVAARTFGISVTEADAIAELTNRRLQPTFVSPRTPMCPAAWPRQKSRIAFSRTAAFSNFNVPCRDPECPLHVDTSHIGRRDFFDPFDFLEGRWLWAPARYLDQVEPDADFLPAASRALYTLPRPIFSAVAMSVTERPALKSFTASSALSRADGLRPM
jgi:hypothetical protein